MILIVVNLIIDAVLEKEDENQIVEMVLTIDIVDLIEEVQNHIVEMTLVVGIPDLIEENVEDLTVEIHIPHTNIQRGGEDIPAV